VSILRETFSHANVSWDARLSINGSRSSALTYASSMCFGRTALRDMYAGSEVECRPVGDGQPAGAAEPQRERALANHAGTA
jgi:hypothetical protein